MAMLAKNLMDIYYAEERTWLKLMEEAEDPNLCLEISFAYSNAESMVNNIMHGRRDADWIPEFVQTMRERASESRPEVAEHFEVIAALAEDSLT